MVRTKERSFGQVLRDRRRQLDLTQEEVARRIKTSTPYIGHLESAKGPPSDKIVTRLAEVLGLDRRELFFLANPRAQALLNPEPDSEAKSAWEDFRKDEQIRRVHNISADEMEMLERVALLGEVRSPRDFIYILNTVRHAVGRLLGRDCLAYGGGRRPPHRAPHRNRGTQQADHDCGEQRFERGVERHRQIARTLQHRAQRCAAAELPQRQGTSERATDGTDQRTLAK